MKYSNDSIDKIYNYKTISDRDKIDRMLEIDANQYCNSGCDATKTEKETIKKNSRYIYRTIAKIDPSMGNNFLQAQDK